MADYSEALVLDVFSSAFVEEALCLEYLGGSKSDPAVVARYLALPMAARPSLSGFFDRAFYLQRYPDISDAGIDPLVHFTRWGIAEKRHPHPLVDIGFMLSQDAALLPDPPTADALADVLARDLVDPSPHFSRSYYRGQLDEAEPVEAGLLRHFLDRGLLAGLQPNPTFDPIAYYRRAEGRTFDVRCALRLFVLGGHLPLEGGEPPTEGQAKTMFRARAEAAQLAHSQAKLSFECNGPADLSVIVVVHDNFSLTMQMLASLRANHAGAIELIVIDSGSTDETLHLARYVAGAQVLRFDANIGYLRGSNVGLEVATADVVLYLNNDIELADGAVEAALRRLRSDPTIGAVGGKVLRAHGLLQEAGCIIWRDGWTVGYQRDESPLAPEANFVRDVDFCSAVFLLARTALLRDLHGYDDAFAPAYFEDADLCVRIRQAGYRVVYDPAVVVHHLEYGTAESVEAPHERIHKAQQIFAQKHRNWLRRCFTSDPRAQLFARSVGPVRGRVLVIEDQLPLRRLGSGFVRSNDIIGMMAGLGYHVTVYPVQQSQHNLAAVYADFADTVEVMHDHSLADLESFLLSRRGYFNTIWIARTHNLDLVKPILEKGGVDVLGGVRVVLDTEAISATREAQRLRLAGGDAPFDLDRALEDELANASFCQSIVAVDAHEAALLQRLGFTDITVLGHVRPLQLTPRPWRDRAGMLFVGALHTMDSPNYDSLCWFTDHVLPLIERELGYETRLTVAGPVGAGVDLSRFEHHPRITLRGTIADMTPLYDSHRVFVAPTRFAAGLPYKVHEAASFGVPVVATEVLRAQLGWTDGQDVLAAPHNDPAAFAREVLALYRSEDLWGFVRAGAAERIRTECTRAACEAALGEILR